MTLVNLVKKPQDNHFKRKKNLPKNTQRKKIWLTVGQNDQSIFIMILISLFLFGAMGFRLAYLQIVQGDKYSLKAENNRTKIIPKPPVRGNLFDRKGRSLGTTRLSYSAYLWPIAQKQENWPLAKTMLANILNISEDNLQNILEKEGYDSPTLVRIARNLTPKQITAIEENRHLLSQVEVDTDTVRYYPHHKIGSHILGYTREINADELKLREKEGYRMGDVIGKMGVEAAFESQLRGEWGGILMERDGTGKVLRKLGIKEAKAGNDVTLTLDLELQIAAEKALGDRKGAVVALDPRDGAVLAMVSYPAFDPNIFSGKITEQIWQEVQAKGYPLINRAVMGFPPASTFKIVTATAGMESGKFSSKTILPTYAYLRVGGTAFGEWNRAGFGPLGFVRALQWSSNTFFGQIGNGVGGETLINWSRKYGFGSKTGIEIPEDTPGLIADNEWKKKRFNWEWTAGDTVNMSIGQGFTQATPLQIAVMFAVPANGGYKVTPHLYQDKATFMKKRESLNLKPETLSTIRTGLRAVVNGGTGSRAAISGVAVAGKSGTAEAPPRKSHTWFGGFAPYDKPEIVVVAFVEHSGGGGGSTAGPIVRQVLEAYFKQK
ncbi:MAG: penicillin-binding protein 2 [Cyanobacteria bacterium]|nr:penicillin-binding protein 2 [Cyanobacteria bacterium CG_2015-16_32_12]NCO79317.1 penicillin-binding protein 2 [Cyanobacteria bacterium CG_2015-22_32_23]NCQ05035.1 penicillin-binding protein 2 [Cyanobacteria bacterium CG_2015-09_32_10]NCQ41341.1 penicillin-binding protein 2 [Cyanobacteria bacterium CG_2015-04_32_10]NCS84053.1 penicillin-binding protein 2 [Cyanobacteria bacterium CG_2015-02_32_10]